MINKFSLCIVFLFKYMLFFGFLETKAQQFFSIPKPPHTDQFVKNISYSAGLLSSSTAEKPKEVKILVYGQSISVQKWWLQVKDFLEKKYPSAKINMINKAIGGFSTDRLKLMVKNDVVSFYPDLIFFHDYGGEPDYEYIIKTIRSNTTAEIIIQTDHVAVGQNIEWHEQHNNVWLPQLCGKYNLALADIRTVWKEYLDQHQLQAKELLTDNVHLNDHGNYLMSGILIKYLELIPASLELQSFPGFELNAGTDYNQRQKALEFTIVGNKVDLKLDPPNKKAIQIKVDGKNPKELIQCYYYTRPTRPSNPGFFLSHIGQLLKLDLDGEPQEEEWTLTISEVDSIEQQVKFKISGSKTGDDGEGISSQSFVSNSGKIKIEPSYWFIRKSERDFSQFSWLKKGDVLKWQVKSMCKNEIEPGTTEETVLQGLENGRHILELKGRDIRKVDWIKVYLPPLKNIE